MYIPDSVCFLSYRASAGYAVECDSEWHTFAPPSPFSMSGFLERVSMKKMHPRSDLSCRSSGTDTQKLAAEKIETSDTGVSACIDLEQMESQQFCWWLSRL